MVLSRDTPAARRERERRRRFAATKEHPEVVEVAKSAGAFRTLGQARAVAGFEELRTNLTLVDNKGQPLFQRIAPTSPDKLTDAIKSAKSGLEKFKTLMQYQPPKNGRGLYHLGYWHSAGQSYLGLTSQSLKPRKTDKETGIQDPETALFQPLLGQWHTPMRSCPIFCPWFTRSISKPSRIGSMA